jgi:23S rRNA pseudouridine1911/1915/1917 synthase
VTARQIRQQAVVSEALSGLRIDQAAARLFPDFSRARLQDWLRGGQLRVDGQRRRPAERLVGGETLSLEAVLEAEERWLAQALSLSVVYEDNHLIVLDKAAGMVVHPAAGHRDGTLVNALLHYDPALAQLPRAGIVHRLDRDTSGLMVVARTLEAHHSLIKQLQARRVHREYQALLQGALSAGGTVDAPIGRHPRQRKKMAVLPHGGKEAITHYQLLRR